MLKVITKTKIIIIIIIMIKILETKIVIRKKNEKIIITK